MCRAGTPRQGPRQAELPDFSSTSRLGAARARVADRRTLALRGCAVCPAMPDEAPRERDARGVDDARAYCALSDDDDPGTGEGEGAGEVRGARGGGRGQSPWQMRPWRVLQARGGVWRRDAARRRDPRAYVSICGASQHGAWRRGATLARGAPERAHTAQAQACAFGLTHPARMCTERPRHVLQSTPMATQRHSVRLKCAPMCASRAEGSARSQICA